MKNRLINDLKLAAFHEAGHLALIRHQGGEGQIVLKPTFTENIKDEKGFVGHAHYTGIGDNLSHRAIIGCAGFIADNHIFRFGYRYGYCIGALGSGIRRPF